MPLSGGLHINLGPVYQLLPSITHDMTKIDIKTSLGEHLSLHLKSMDFRLEIKLSEAQKNILEHPKFKTLVARYTFLGSMFDMEQ